MSVISLAEEYSSERPRLIMERLLREQEGIWRQIRLDYGLNELLRQMLLSSTMALACYGAVIGATQGNILQMLSSAVKLPLLYLLTLAICMPALYIFNLLRGGSLSARQVLTLVLGATTLIATVTLALAPIALFFLVTAWSYSFFLLLNVVILALTGGIGLRFLLRGVIYLNTAERSITAERGVVTRADWDIPGYTSPNQIDRSQIDRQFPQISTGLIQLWLLLYAFVGTQLSWALRPFFGKPSQPFTLFDNLQGNFYTGVLERILSLL